MEGVITCLAGFVGYFMIVDFPELAANSWRFLTPAESEFVVARIEKDRHDAIPEPFNLGSYLKNALDLKIWGFAWLFMLATTNSYAIAYFLQGVAGACSRFTRGKSAERRSRGAILFSYEELRRVPPRLRLSKGESPREGQGLRLG